MPRKQFGPEKICIARATMDPLLLHDRDTLGSLEFIKIVTSCTKYDRLPGNECNQNFRTTKIPKLKKLTWKEADAKIH